MFFGFLHFLHFGGISRVPPMTVLVFLNNWSERCSLNPEELKAIEELRASS